MKTSEKYNNFNKIKLKIKRNTKKQSIVLDMFNFLKRSRSKNKKMSKTDWLKKMKYIGLEKYMQARDLQKKTTNLKLLWIRSMLHIRYKIL